MADLQTTISRRLMLGTSLALLAGQGAARAQGSRSTIEAPIDVGDHRVAISGLLNGRGPYRFVIDTGAELSGVRSDLARELDLPRVRTVRLAGAQFQLFRVSELVLGGAVRQADAALFGLEEASALGGDGLLAAGLVTSFDSELIHGEGRWRVHPAGLPTMDGYGLVNARLQQPRVSGLASRIHGVVRIGDQEVDAVWDTGSPYALSLSPIIAERLGLLRPDVAFAPVATRTIRGRPTTPSRLFKSPAISIGTETFEGGRVLVRMDDPFPNTAILGFPVLRQVDLAIAGQGQRFGLRRNTLKVVNLSYGLSGLWVDAASDGVEVVVVGNRSPGAEAGIEPGDKLTNFRDLASTIEALRGPPGASIEVTYRRGNSTRSTTLTLRDFLSEP